MGTPVLFYIQCSGYGNSRSILYTVLWLWALMFYSIYTVLWLWALSFYSIYSALVMGTLVLFYV